MKNSEFPKLKDNNPYKEKCENVEEKLNEEDFYKSTVIMGISLEKLTNDLIKNNSIEILDEKKITQSGRIIKLKENGVINYNLSNDFHVANKLRNFIVHGDEDGNPLDEDTVYKYTYSLRNHFLKIMSWYDENYVPEKINPITELKQYLNKVCDDSSIINIIEQEINDIKITEKSQIIKRIKEELTKYVESLNIEFEIKEKIIKEISSGIIRNMSQIDEKTKGQKKNPIIGVANIVNTENMMKYTIQSTDIDKELKENMNKLENNTHENKQLQEDYNKYGPSSFTTETVTICKNKAQSKLVEKDEIIFNATKSYNYISKKEKESEDICEPNIANAENNNESTLQSADIDKELKENKENMENKEDEIISDINKSDKPNNQSNGFGNRIRKIFKK